LKRDSADVVVVGSGAGGGPVAYWLARMGARVVILEKGRSYRPEDFVHDEIRMTRRNFYVPYIEDEPHTLRYGQNERAWPTTQGWTANVLGGATSHFSGFFYRMHPVDMRLRSELGAVPGANLVDWPIPYHHMEPYYRRVEEIMGVSGRWKQHPFEEPRSADFPMPPLLLHPVSERFKDAMRAAGYHPFEIARAIASGPFRGRPGCCYNVACGKYGCPKGNKSGTVATVLPEAVATGRCEIRAQCMATEIGIGKDGRATGVVYRDAKEASHFIGARCVVLAASAVESARLLLLSRSARFPDGVANGSGLVGKNLIFTGHSLGGASFVKGKRTAILDAEMPFATIAMQDLYVLEEPIDGVRKLGTIMFALSHPDPIARAMRVVSSSDEREIWGKQLKDGIRTRIRDMHHIAYEGFTEFFANRDTYVDLDPRVKDRWGVPVARMTVAPHPLSYRAATMLGEKAMEILRSMDPQPDHVALGDIHGETKFLQGGTCRFGDDPATSVLDRSCRAHEVPNLYVTDGSFLPTTGGVPNTWTIMANSFRVGDLMAGRFKDGEL